MKKALTIYLLTFSIINANIADDYINSGVRGDNNELSMEKVGFSGMCESCTLTENRPEHISINATEYYTLKIYDKCYDTCRNIPYLASNDNATATDTRLCNCSIAKRYKLTCKFCRSLSSNKNLAAPQDSAPKELIGRCRNSDMPYIGFWGGDGKAGYGYRTTPIIKCQDPEGNFYNAKMEY